MNNQTLRKRISGGWQPSHRLVLGLALTCVSPIVAAQSIPAQMTVNSPGLVRMIDGTDPGSQVAIHIYAPRLWREGYDFGYMEGQAFYSLIGGRNGGSASFAGGALVDFALRRRDDGDDSNTLDEQYYKLSDSTSDATQHYFVPINPRNSRNPEVDSVYYQKLTLFWDPDKDYDRDVKVMLTTMNRFDGMQFESPTPVPLPPTMWLFGSGLSLLVSLDRLVKRSKRS